MLESQSDWRPSRVCLEKQEMRKYSINVSLEFCKVFFLSSVKEISVKNGLRFILREQCHLGQYGNNLIVANTLNNLIARLPQ